MKKYIILLFFSILSLEVFAYLNGTLIPGKSIRLEVSTSSGEYSPDWYADNPTVLLTGSGFYRDVTAQAYFSGTCRITCKFKWRLGNQEIEELREWEYDCQENQLILFSSNINIKVGEKDQIEWSFALPTYLNPAMQFTGYDHNVISITSDGIITGIKPGRTTVWVYSSISTNSEPCYIEVEKVEPTFIEIPDLIINEDDSAVMEATLFPEYAQAELQWWVENPEIVSIEPVSDYSVLIKALTVGSTFIHVLADNGLETISPVTVRSTVPKSISLGQDLNLKFGSKLKLEATLFPEYAISDLIWESNKEDIVEVRNNGLIVCKKEGEALVRVRTVRGDKTDAIKVKVAPKPTHLVVQFEDGARCSYEIEDHPRIEMNKNTETISIVTKNVKIEIPRENIHLFSCGVKEDYECVFGYIEPKIFDFESGEIEFCNGIITFSNFKPFSKIQIYSIRGILISQKEVDNDGCLSISLDYFDKGVYIIKADNKSIKINKR